MEKGKIYNIIIPKTSFQKVNRGVWTTIVVVATTVIGPKIILREKRRNKEIPKHKPRDSFCPRFLSPREEQFIERLFLMFLGCERVNSAELE